MSVTALKVSTKPTVLMEMITPKQARAIIDANNDGNRPLTQARVDKYAWDMQNDRWTAYTGETIKFSRDERLLDGQHRLHAVIKAGMAVEFLVVRNLAEEVFTKIDIGKNRSGMDVVAIEHKLNAQVAAMVNTATGMAMIYERNSGAVPAYRGKKLEDRMRAGNDSVIAWLQTHPDMIAAAEFVHENHRPGSLLTRGILTWACYETRRISPDEGDQYIQDIINGAGLSQADPVTGLRDMLIKEAQAHRKAGRDCVLAAVVKAWNRRRKPPPGANLHSSIIRRDWSNFPRFI